MPGISATMVKNYIDDGYDYMLETYDKEALNEVAPLIYAEKTIDGEGWQMTKVVNSGNWRKTDPSESFVPSQPRDGYTVQARVFDFTQSANFNNDTVADSQKMKNLLRDISGGWGETAIETREDFYARPFNQGGKTAGDWIFNGTVPSGAWTDASGNGLYDGTAASPKPFFCLSNNTRSSIAGGTYYNSFALQLSPTNLKTIYLHGTGTNNKRENDTQFNLRLDTLLIPTALTLTADEIMNSALTAYDSLNTKNSLAGRLKPVAWSFLTDTDAYFVGLAKKGITMLKRMEPTFDIFQDKKNRCWWAVAEMRMGVMIHDWRFWLASQVATS